MADQGVSRIAATHNVQHRFAYDDLRDWLTEAERLNELEVVKGATWEQDIGLAATVVKYNENSPAVIFDFGL